jgi:hypothetical protein
LESGAGLRLADPIRAVPNRAAARFAGADAAAAIAADLTVRARELLVARLATARALVAVAVVDGRTAARGRQNGAAEERRRDVRGVEHQAGAGQVGVEQARAAEVGPAQVGVAEGGPLQAGPAEVGPEVVRVVEVGLAPVDVAEVGAAVVAAGEVLPGEVAIAPVIVPGHGRRAEEVAAAPAGLGLHLPAAILPALLAAILVLALAPVRVLALGVSAALLPLARLGQPVAQLPAEEGCSEQGAQSTTTRLSGRQHPRQCVEAIAVHGPTLSRLRVNVAGRRQLHSRRCGCYYCTVNARTQHPKLIIASLSVEAWSPSVQVAPSAAFLV